MNTADRSHPKPEARTAALPGLSPAQAHSLRGGEFVLRRRRWPGLLAAGLVGSVVAAALVSSLYDRRSFGERLDAGVTAAAGAVDQQVGQVQQAVGDANITAAVKTALAADPGLSAVKISVSTEAGVVRLQGPAPDDVARERAAVIAAAPQGVVRVDNQLVVPVGMQAQAQAAPRAPTPATAAATPARVPDRAPALVAEPMPAPTAAPAPQPAEMPAPAPVPVPAPAATQDAPAPPAAPASSPQGAAE